MDLVRYPNSRAIFSTIFLILCLLAPACSVGAFAPPAPSVARQATSNFTHFGYLADNGAPPDVGTIAQGSNGDLWLASTNGLFTFDGLRFQRFEPSGSGQLRSDLIYSMFIDSRRRIWLGYYSGGVSVVIDGRVRTFEGGLPAGPLKGFAEDRQGRIWATSVKGLSYFEGDRWHALRGELRPQDGAPYVILAARDGTLWIGTSAALLFIRPGTLLVEHSDVPVTEAWALAQAPDGRLWLSDEGHGTRPIAPKPGEAPAGVPAAPRFRDLVARRLQFDREGGLWMALQRQPGIALQRQPGVVRLDHPDAVPTGASVSERDISRRFRDEDGLTSNVVGSLIEDRHGVVWAGSRLGIDRFTPVPYVMRNEIATVPPSGFRAVQSSEGQIAVADDDFIYLYTSEGLPRRVVRSTGTVRGICAGDKGGMFIAGDAGLSQIVAGTLRSIPLPRGLKSPLLFGCQVDRTGGIWILTRKDGVFVRRGDEWSNFLRQDAIGGASPRLMVLDALGRLWLGADNSGLALLANGRLRRFGAPDGLEIGFIQSAQAIDHGLLFGGELGIAKFDGQGFRSLRSRDYPRLSLVSGIARARDGDYWISGSRGIVHLGSSELPRLLDRVSRGQSSNRLDVKGDIPLYPQLNCCANTILTAASGDLWFLTAQGVAWLPPSREVGLVTPPQPIIRSITSNGEKFRESGTLTLSKGHPDINIEFTSDSVANAQQIQFRYRLTGGSDDRWVDSGSRRQASYTSLKDGSYEFELQARDVNGVWNRRTATLSFVVPPTFLQTIWPRIFALVIAVALIMLIYRIRLGYAVEAVRKRLDERMRERERIARDLHDSLLQSVQALIFRIDGAKRQIASDSLAHNELEASLEQAENVLEETRQTVQGLRLSAETPSLDALLERIVKRLALEPQIATAIRIKGSIGPLDSHASDEIERIVSESLTNVVRHAAATAVDISVAADRRELRISIADNGCGMPSDVMETGHRAGHFGLLGICERANRLNAQIGIASSVGQGTQITLVVPAIVAFAPRRMLKPAWLWNGRAKAERLLEHS